MVDLHSGQVLFCIYESVSPDAPKGEKTYQAKPLARALATDDMSLPLIRRWVPSTARQPPQPHLLDVPSHMAVCGLGVLLLRQDLRVREKADGTRLVLFVICGRERSKTSVEWLCELE